jgi:hypothetical protein
VNGSPVCWISNTNTIKIEVPYSVSRGFVLISNVIQSEPNINGALLKKGIDATNHGNGGRSKVYSK